jgi:uncharacterized membrane protein YoaK (UPF0700 family)
MHPRRQRQLVLALEGAAGVTDAFVLLHFQVLTATMPGNAAALALSVSHADTRRIAIAAVVLVCFVAGVALAARLAGPLAPGAGWSPALSRLLAVELALLAVFALAQSLAPALAYLIVGAAALAMGMQNLLLQRLAIPGALTTAITASLVAAVARRVDGGRPPATLPDVLAGIPLAYAAGALVLGTATVSGVGLIHLLPAAIVAGALLAARGPRRPAEQPQRSAEGTEP